MDPITILAEAVEATDQTLQTAEAAEEAIVPINLIWEHITSLNLLEALTFISFGVVCLFYGWRIFKILVIISFALGGLLLGIAITDKISGPNHQLLGAAIGLVLMVILSMPLMRWAVSILGALAGGILTSGIWYASGLTEKFIWAGALIGVVAGCMISFIIFKIAVMLFSSLGGSGLMVVGTLALLYIYPKTTARVEELVFTEKWFLPVALLVPTAVGIFVQNKFIKNSKNWDI